MEAARPDDVERELRAVAAALTTPLPRECLLCFVWRLVEAFGCNATLRWARHWRDGRAPRATAMEHRLGARGAFCDCQIFLNAWDSRAVVEARSASSTEAPTAAAARVAPAACPGVRRGSAQPCQLWIRHEAQW